MSTIDSWRIFLGSFSEVEMTNDLQASVENQSARAQTNNMWSEIQGTKIWLSQQPGYLPVC